MRLPDISSALLAAAAIAAWPGSPSAARDNSDTGVQMAQAQVEPNATARKKRTVQPGPGVQIACTHVGCNPIPRGCRIEKEYSWDGTPTGFDLVVCPFR
jgi:hypothetical protein